MQSARRPVNAPLNQTVHNFPQNGRGKTAPKMCLNLLEEEAVFTHTFSNALYFAPAASSAVGSISFRGGARRRK
jgi:hypothetical protein